MPELAPVTTQTLPDMSVSFTGDVDEKALAAVLNTAAVIE